MCADAEKYLKLKRLLTKELDASGASKLLVFVDTKKGCDAVRDLLCVALCRVVVLCVCGGVTCIVLRVVMCASMFCACAETSVT